MMSANNAIDGSENKVNLKELKFKLVVIGSGAVGKTTCTRQFTKGNYWEKESSTFRDDQPMTENYELTTHTASCPNPLPEDSYSIVNDQETGQRFFGQKVFTTEELLKI